MIRIYYVWIVVCLVELLFAFVGVFGVYKDVCEFPVKENNSMDAIP